MARKSTRKASGRGGARPKKIGARRMPARTSSAREEKRGVGLVRLNKYLADHGVASRRGCDALIEAGKVAVDGEPVTELGTKIDPATQEVEVGGRIFRAEGEARHYYLLNKPQGVVCTNEKRETRPRAIDLVTDKDKGRIYTVGRLDEESTGLILLTDDGEFAQRVAHPSHGVPKTYKVKLEGKISDEAIQKVREGVHLSEGRTGGARILVKRRTPKYSHLAVVLREGMNREIRRAFARVGFKVVALERTDIGPLTSRGLRVGRWRALSREEVEALLKWPGGAERSADESTASPERERARTPRVDRGGFGSRRGGTGSRRGGPGSRRGGPGSRRGGTGSRRGGTGSRRAGLRTRRRAR